MPRTPLLTALFGLMMSTGAVAAARGELPAAAVAPDHDPAVLRQSTEGASTEVTQLQRDLAAQERRSREADQRLREQDRKLEQLRRQLHAVQTGAQTPAQGP